MNEIFNKFLLAENKFMAEMHLKQPGFTYNTYDLFNKNKDRIQKFIQTVDTRYIYWNDLDKACFQHNMAYGSYKDLVKRAESDKILRDKGYDGYQRGLASMIYKLFDK